MRKGRIIACFSGVGKTHYVVNNFRLRKMVDHDMYDWMTRLGDRWIENYIDRMRELQRYFDEVYVNAFSEILSNLDSNSLVIYPRRNLKEEWIQRIKRRNAGSNFPKLLDEKWDEWITACEISNNEQIIVESGEYLNDVYNRTKK